ncbi:MAG: hypothetical protein GY853_13990 [PVC group bacterium]|nr:hypothetical protein [PVC group bacterium]
MFKCEICAKKDPEHLDRCEKHYFCADCKTKENLCYYIEGLLCYSCHKNRVEKRIEKFGGETQFTGEIICPYCGYEFADSWDYSSGKLECEDCENEFEVAVNTEISYSTSKIDKKRSDFGTMDDLPF